MEFNEWSFHTLVPFIDFCVNQKVNKWRNLHNINY